MHRVFSNRLAWLFVCGALLLASASVAQRGGPATIGVDEIRPGMRGHGLTVFRGETPERFDVEVIDVLHDFRPDQDLILVRTPHPILDHARAVGGMSGSPIYLDGRLAGAYAYGWQFGVDPVVGVTPIRNMLAEIDRPVRPDSFPGAVPLGAQRAAARPRARRAPALAGLPAWRGSEDALSAFDAVRAHRDRLGLGDPDAMPASPRPASTPLMLGGFHQDAAAALGRELAPFGLMAMQGGGTGQGTGGSANPAYVDGGAIGVQLVSGDISATAIGTVTHVGGGDRLIAFGHPMMNAGEVGLPTATARVVHIFASAARSFKIAEAIQPLGTLIHDRQAAIVVDSDLRPATVPVRLRITGVPDSARTEWNMRVASHRMLTPVLLFGAVNNAIKSAASDQADVMYTATARVTIVGHAPIEVVDRGFMNSGPADGRALSRLRVFELLEIAYGNPFVESRVERIELDLDVSFGDDVLQIISMQAQSDDVDPGAEVDVRVRLRRFGQSDDIFRTVRVRIPEQAAGETIRVSLGGGNSVRREQPVARNLDDLVERTLDRYPATSMVVSLKMPSRGLRFRGHVASSLPRSALNSLQRTSGTGPGRPFITQQRTAVDVGEVVVGDSSINLRVREVARANRLGTRRR